MSWFPNQEPSVVIPAQIDPIETERLILRPLRVGNDEDAKGIFQYRRQRDVMKWLYSPPPPPDLDISVTKEWMAGKIFTTPDASGAVGRQFMFVILEKKDPQRIVGNVGVHSLLPSPSLGYAVHPDFWGRGYATEAVGGLMNAWWKLPRRSKSERVERVERFYAGCKSANVGSMKVLERNGFKVFQEVSVWPDMISLMYLERPQDRAN